MDENLVDTINEVTEEQPSATTPQAPTPPVSPVEPAPQPVQPVANPIKKPSNKKSLFSTIFLSFISVIAIAAAGVFAYLYFTKPTCNPSTPSDVVSETDITDEAEKESLQKTVNTLFQVSTTGTSITVKDINYPDVELFSQGSISLATAVSIAVKSIPEDQFVPLSTDVAPSVRAVLDSQGYEDVATDGILIVNADTVAASFKKLFGYELDKTASIFGEYLYDANNNIYFNNPGVISGEGDTSRYYYISRLTEAETSIYVYVSGAFLDKESNTVYCSVFDPALDEEKPSVCANIDENDSFKLDNSNYKDYTTSRFQFMKNGDGDYIFVSSEIVSE